jgi:sugar phosphate isomerase/epimerase
MTEPVIGGFGFAALGERSDLEDLDRELGRIEEVGATHAELSLCGAHIIAGGRILPEMRRRLETICARRRLRYTVHGFLGVNFMDEPNLPAHKAACRAMLELAGIVGASTVVHHPGMTPMKPEGELDRLHALERDALREMGDVAARHDLRIAVETLFVESLEAYTPDPVRLAREIRAIDHPHVVGTLDVSHSRLMTSLLGTSFEEAVHAFAPVAGHVHLHDSFGRPTKIRRFYGLAERIAFGMGDLHLPFGWGDIPFESLLPGLPFLPDTTFIVELPGHFRAELEACADFARRLVDRCNAVAPA